MILTCSFGTAQQITNAEYFWDTDPGQGNGTAILALDGAMDEAIEQVLSDSVNLPSVGIHSFNLRVLGLNGTWSNLFTHVINVKNNTLTTRIAQVTQAEYYWDTDPGQGLATSILAQDGGFNEIIEQLFADSVSLPSAGLHSFHLRVLGEDGFWSNAFSYAVNVKNNTIITRTTQLTQAEYFWDVDPDQGNGFALLMVNGTLDHALECISESPSSFPSDTGLHVFYLRVLGTDNTWSNAFGHLTRIGGIPLSYGVINPTICQGASYTVPSGNDVYTTAGIYTDTIPNIWGGDSILTIHLDVHLPTTGDTNVTKCGSFAWYGNTYSSSGDYDHTFVGGNAAGCDSVVTLHLVIDSSNTVGDTSATQCSDFTWYGTNYSISGDYNHTFPGGNAAGCDSVLTLHLTIVPGGNTTGDTSATVCNSINWYGSTYSSSGDYNYTFIGGNAGGCDSVLTLHLTINSSGNTNGDTTASACGNFDWYGNTYSSSGDYDHTFIGGNATGCDSVLTLHLTINSSAGTTGDTTVSACGNFDWYGNTYSSSGDYEHTFIGGNATGCDSVLTLHLSIHSATTGDTTANACGNFDWHGNTYSSSGDYEHTFIGGNATGCDSVLTLHLSIHSATTGDTSATVCSSIMWHGNTYNGAGDYIHTLVASNGCDSVLTLHLTVLNTLSGDTTAVECGSFTWHGITYTSSSEPVHVYTNALGCDSIVTLHLTIKTVNTAVTSVNNTLFISSSTGSYRWLNCDNGYSVIGGETNQVYAPSNSGIYAAEITEDGCVDTSQCFNILFQGLEDEILESVRIYPNPTHGEFYVEFTTKMIAQNASLQVRNVLGQIVFERSAVNQKVLPISENLGRGVYFVTIQIGDRQQTLKLVHE